ncbi:MAG: class II aldolase/adducin family protein [Armatimonadetes bacterium]|nr:class II aldolase/adducin family protein [Armatimonadota bacterium]
MERQQISDALVSMSLEIGRPENDYVILGEGNTSARLSDASFAVKASGKPLLTASSGSFVEVYFEPVLRMLELASATDEEVKTLLQQARVDQTNDLRPSVETVLHASLLSLPGVNYVGHTHATAVNAVLCSKGWKEAISGRLFPDEIVSCGIAPVAVEYVDPGLPLAKELHRRVNDYASAVGAAPKVVLMQNHGIIALGASPDEVLGITAMSVKAFRILAGTSQFGGPNFLSEENVLRISSRPDELYRMKMIRGTA